ncbi:alpha/beta hydrolase family protein [Candidatus Laterigemmans baculatus]|uniref:alpha/beta hydrolase family protein n=1 Tax=Candidatus Laterigemmans baculatus TaxID=2770505 RepID=UPI0013DBC458|nr:acetylxylan esterase [Candidatus Laterigemmans baculatus]
MTRCLLTASIILATIVPLPLAAVRGADPPPLRTLDSHFPFTPPESLDAWKERAAEVRQRIRVACGIWPMPTVSDAEPWIGEERVFAATQEAPGYSVAPITIESLHGLHVTGSLYRPYPPRAEPGPGILCPHGHWPEGRFHDAGEPAARNQIASGAERYMAAARSPIQARCVQLARMGCTVLLYDMLGYADSSQISFERAHRYARQSAEENQPTEAGWLLYSPLAEGHLQSSMALQTIHSLTALEVLRKLPQVDAERIAITGASGGGTQSFIAAAIDERIAAAFPAVMVSTGMQGGCTCENACLLRDGTGNVEIAAAIAPRPLGLTAADDWTRTMPEDGFPELKQLYGLWNAGDAVALHPAVHYGHNYNHVSRTAMYGFINKAFELGLEMPVLESDFERLGEAELTVWSESHPRPEGGTDFERRLLRKWAEQTEQPLRAAVEAAENDGGQQFDETVAAGWKVVLGPPPAEVSISEEATAETREAGMIRGHGEAIFGDGRRVAVHGLRSDAEPRGVLLVAHPGGAALLSSNGSDAADAAEGQAEDEAEAAAREGIAAAVAAGWAVVVAELEGSGEERQPLVREDRLAAAYTYGYNAPLVVRQARQLVAAAAGIQQYAERQAGAEAAAGLPIRLVGCDGLAPAAAIARALAPERFAGCVLETNGFRFASTPAIDHSQFLPGAVRYLDLPGLLALSAEGSLTVLGERPESLQVTERIFDARGKAAGSRQPTLKILAESDAGRLWKEAIEQ